MGCSSTLITLSALGLSSGSKEMLLSRICWLRRGEASTMLHETSQSSDGMRHRRMEI
jgi:hypothetical protein